MPVISTCRLECNIKHSNLHFYRPPTVILPIFQFPVYLHGSEATLFVVPLALKYATSFFAIVITFLNFTLKNV